MHAPHAAQGDQTLSLSEQRNVRFAAALVAHADEPPGDRVAKGLARRLFGGKRAGKTLGAMAMTQRVGHLFDREDLLRETLKSGGVEIETLHFCDVGPQTDDHALMTPITKGPRRTSKGSVEIAISWKKSGWFHQQRRHRILRTFGSMSRRALSA